MSWLNLLRYGDSGWLDELLRGALNTMALLLVAFPAGLLLGLGLAFVKNSRDYALRIWGNLLTSLLRGIPELLTLFMIYFFGQRLLNWVTQQLALPSFNISAYLCGVIALSIVTMAYASEVFLGNLKAMETTSIEAARALGLGRFATLRFIVVPELMRLSEPGLANLWLAILKRSALVSTLSYVEVLRVTQVAAGSSGYYLFFYLIGCVFYIVMAHLTRPVFKFLIGSRQHQRIAHAK